MIVALRPSAGEFRKEGVEMEVVFIRHKMSHTVGTLRELWLNKLIAVHFADVASTNPEDYPEKDRWRVRLAFNRLKKCCERGAIVGADFSVLHPKMLVGEIKPRSKIEAIEVGEGKLGKTKFIYKVVQLERAKEVSYTDYPLLLAIQPRRGTITRWQKAKRYLNAILGSGDIPWSVNSLAPSQLEVLCYEFLRSAKTPTKMKLDFLLMPIGRTLKDIDIVGVTMEGKKLFAQITHGSSNLKEMEEKINALRKYESPNTVLIFFGPEKLYEKILEKSELKSEIEPIEYTPIEGVFKLLTSNENSSTYRMIQKMLDWSQ